MDASLDLSRWSDAPLGVAYRRWTIISTGLQQLFRLRFFKILLALAWCGGVALAALGFLFSQSVATDGWLATLAAQIGPRQHAAVSALNAMVLLYPDVCIGGSFTLIFWLHSFFGLWLSLVALTVLVPRLITRDRASNALIVYLSRPLTSGDYLIGKLGMIVGVLLAVWTGPLLLGWLLSMAFASDRDFIVYSLEPLVRALAFNGVALVLLAALALGISAVGRSSSYVVVLWLSLWLIVGSVSQVGLAPDWLKRASFTYDLNQARAGIIRVGDAFAIAGEMLPVTDQQITQGFTRAGNKTQSTDFNGALASLGAFVALSSIVFMRRLKPQ